MKLYIPELGDEIRLIADWNFGLYNEDRNTSLMAYMADFREPGYFWRKDVAPIPCTIPAGAVLKIDRIYIRKGQEDFNSITFCWQGMAIPAHMEEITTYVWLPDGKGVYQPTGKLRKVPKKPIRFWAKMSDVNTIEFE